MLDLDVPINAKSNKANEETIDQLVKMGFTRNQAMKALKNANNNPEAAVEWLFSHPEALENDEMVVDVKKEEKLDTSPGSMIHLILIYRYDNNFIHFRIQALCID